MANRNENIKLKEKNINWRSFQKSAQTYEKGNKLSSIEDRLITQFFKKKRLLDVGCGCGRTTIALLRKGFVVTGIDYSQNLIRIAKRKYPQINFKIMDAIQLQFNQNTFDNVFFSYNGLDYIYPYEKRLKALKEMHRVLKPQGILLYSSHNQFYFKFPIKLTYPFIEVHYILSMLHSLFTFKKYRYEKHPFGLLKTYCQNNSVNDAKKVGFAKVIRIPNGYNCYYLCYAQKNNIHSIEAT